MFQKIFKIFKFDFALNKIYKNQNHIFSHQIEFMIWRIGSHPIQILYSHFFHINDIVQITLLQLFIMRPQIIQNLNSEILEGFNTLINKIERIDWKKAILMSSNEMNVKNLQLDKLNPQKIKNMYKIMIEKYCKQQNVKYEWQENQLSIFIWLIISYSSLIQKKLTKFTSQDWNIFPKYFFDKEIFELKFQYHYLRKFSIKIQKWTPEQNQLLTNIISSFQNHLKWSKVSKLIFEKSNQKYFKTAKQCRQRWNNYLDPKKYKGQWKLEQDLFLVQNIIKIGKKWTIIANLLKNKRTQHSVKNRYKSLVLKQKKKEKIYKTIAELQLLKKIENRIRKQLNIQSDIQQNINISEIQNNNYDSNHESFQQYQMYQKKYDFVDNQVNYVSIEQNYQNTAAVISECFQQKKQTLLIETYQQRYSQMALDIQQNNENQQKMDYYELDFLGSQNQFEY